MIFGNPVRQASIRPVGAPNIAGNFRVTQDFGPATETAEARVVWPGGEGIAAGTYAHFHRGIDLGDGKCGADVIAAASGIVKVSGKDVDGAIRVIIDHGGGWDSRYWHLSSERVSVGQSVARGQQIGILGSTGNSTACHLHFATYLDGKPLDPWRRLQQNQPVVTTPPPTPPTVGDDMPAIINYIPGQTAVIKGPANVRDGAKLTAKVLRLVSATETWIIVGWVKGDTDPVGGSDLWLCRWATDHWEYTAKSNVGSVADMTPVTQATLDVANGRIASKNAKIKTAQAALADALDD